MLKTFWVDTKYLVVRIIPLRSTEKTKIRTQERTHCTQVFFRLIWRVMTVYLLLSIPILVKSKKLKANRRCKYLPICSMDYHHKTITIFQFGGYSYFISCFTTLILFTVCDTKHIVCGKIRELGEPTTIEQHHV